MHVHVCMYVHINCGVSIGGEGVVMTRREWDVGGGGGREGWEGGGGRDGREGGGRDGREGEGGMGGRGEGDKRERKIER